MDLNLFDFPTHNFFPIKFFLELGITRKMHIITLGSLLRPLVENHCSNTLTFFVVVSYINSLCIVWVFARWILTSHVFHSGAGGPECPIISAAVTHAQLSGARETTRAARHALVWASEPAHRTGARLFIYYFFNVCDSEICTPEYSFLKWASFLHALKISTAGISCTWILLIMLYILVWTC